MATPLSESLGQDAAARIVLITGMRKGLGRDLVLELASHRHIIIGCSHDQTKLDSLRVELSKLSPTNHFLFNIDVRSNNKVETFARTVVEKKIIPNIIVNNSGTANRKGRIWEIDVEDFDNVIDTNVKGIANILRHFIPLMIPSRQRIIINISSIYGKIANGHVFVMSYINVIKLREKYIFWSRGLSIHAAYCASKWAVEGLRKSVAKELREGLTIVASDPGIVYTNMLVSVLGDFASQYQSPQH